jgi:peptidoglycan/xylan/chitin deacetylase (PgdA/CDA1 family)
MLSLLVLGILTATGVWVYMLSLPNETLPTNPIQIGMTIRPQDKTAAQNVTTKYMHAFLTHQYHIMWSLLNPQVQRVWTNEETFATYWYTRFQAYTLHTFTLGQEKTLSSWTNPETMIVYSHVEQLSVSLQLDLNVSQKDGVPPEDVRPSLLFQNLPFIVQHVNDTHTATGRWLVLNGGPADLEAPILPPIIPVTTSVNVPILMYHHISDAPTHNVLDKSLTVTSLLFNQQLDHLKTQGYSTITFNQLFDALYYNGPLPRKPILLTFDDGYDDAYTVAYPALVKHGFSGMFYIITGKVGWQGQMTWPQLSQMLTNGMQMGSHTVHHVDMGQVYTNSPEQAQQELQVSRATMQQRLGIVIQQFCYPSGEPFRHGSLALRQAIVNLLASDGYIGATTDPGMTGVEQSSQSPFVLLRLRIDGRDGLDNFIARLP